MAVDDQIQSNMMDDETAMKKAKQPTYEELFKMVQQQQKALPPVPAFNG